MAYIELRTFLRGSHSEWAQSSVGPLEIRPARAVLAAALASPPPPAGHRGDISGPLLEASLLRAHLTLDEPGMLRWRERLHAAPPHLRRYLTQAAAIAITVELAEFYGWDPFGQNHRLFWYDELKVAAPELSLMMPGGAFPDILFETSDGWVSLESRGRGGVSPATAPNTAQAGRLHELEEWARLVSSHLGYEPAWGMGWTWFSADDTRTDLFDPGEPVHFTEGAELALQTFGSEVESRFAISIRNAPSNFSIDDLDGSAVVSVVETDGAEVPFVGVALGPEGRRVKRERSRQDFDVVPYGGLLFFAGRIARERVGETESFVREAIEAEID